MSIRESTATSSPSRDRPYRTRGSADIMKPSLGGLIGKYAVLIVILMVVGAILGGAEGGMWAVAIGHAFGAIIWWSALLYQVGQPSPEPIPSDEASPVTIGGHIDGGSE